MRVVLTRDSVCMGDDCYAPHLQEFTVDGATTLGELVEQVANYPLRMRGARWVLFRGWNQAEGAPIAEVSPEWDSPHFTGEPERLLPVESLVPADADLELFFQYRPGTVPLAEPPDPEPAPFTFLDRLIERVLDLTVGVWWGLRDRR